MFQKNGVKQKLQIERLLHTRERGANAWSDHVGAGAMAGPDLLTQGRWADIEAETNNLSHKYVFLYGARYCLQMLTSFPRSITYSQTMLKYDWDIKEN